MSSYHLHHHNDDHSHDDDHGSNHSHHDHHEHNINEIRSSRVSSFKIIMIITAVFAAVEFIGGYLTHSLALVSDAFHMITDSSAIFLALIMSHISTKPADHNHSYGHGRADILGAFINSLFMLGIIGFLIYESIDKFIHPNQVNSLPMIVIATLGLLVNVIAAKILHGHQTNLNSRAAFLHVLGDLLSSVATIFAGIIIYYTQWNFLDPLLSLLIALILIPSTVKIIKDSIHILMEGVPHNIHYDTVGKEISSLQNIYSVHDLHIWTMNSEHISLSAHIVVKNIEKWDDTLINIQKLLSDKYKIHHVTLQPEILKNQTINFVNH